jgi:hypothetical protein
MRNKLYTGSVQVSGFGIYSYETTFQKLELVLSWATLHFVGWVEPTLSFVGFLRLRRTNLHFTGIFVKCETQQRPISELSPKSF